MEVEIKKSITLHNDELEVIVRGDVTPGCPEQGPTYSCGGQPAEPDTVDGVAVFFEKTVRSDGKLDLIEEDITFLFTESALEDLGDELIQSAREEAEESEEAEE